MVLQSPARSRHGPRTVLFATVRFAVVPDAWDGSKGLGHERADCDLLPLHVAPPLATHDGYRSHRVTNRNVMDGTGYPGPTGNRDRRRNHRQRSSDRCIVREHPAGSNTGRVIVTWSGDLRAPAQPPAAASDADSSRVVPNPGRGGRILRSTPRSSMSPWMTRARITRSRSRVMVRAIQSM
jgi:hypothetical protein